MQIKNKVPIYLIKSHVVTAFSHIKQKQKFIFITMLLFLLLYLIAANNDVFYKTPIAKISKVTNKFEYTAQEEGNGAGENHYSQTIEAVIQNGTHQGTKITLKSEYANSGVYTEKYKKGDKLFLTIKEGSDGSFAAVIAGVKRDQQVVFLVLLFFLLLVLFEKKKGVLTGISLLVNIIIFTYALNLYIKGLDILWASMGMALFFCVFSLLCGAGVNKKSFSAVVATLLSVVATMLLAFVTIYKNKSMDYALMEYLVMPNDAAKIFMAEILLGSLGAVMDVSISITASVQEMVDKNNGVTKKEAFQSGREIGSDIMGTMMNVLLFTYVCGGIPFLMIAMKNGISLLNIINVYLPFEIYRFLTGSIGILFSIPISLFVSVLLLTKGRKKE